MPRIVVTGSLNMDFVVQVDALPAPGQTVLGRDFLTVAGGKGANQAYAAGMLASSGTSVAMLGCVGQDIFGEQLKASLVKANVDVSNVKSISGSSGVALISVDRAGQNSIVVAPGANAAFRAEPLYADASHALFQLETPLEQVAAALQMARDAGAATILDPAPAQPLPRELLECVDIFTPNETEAEAFVGPAGSPLETAQRLRDLGPGSVILKLGVSGCLYFNGRESIVCPGVEVQAVDTTAAGDCFNGALAVAFSERRPIAAALRFANAAAAISVTRRGAQPSMPDRAAVEKILK